MKSRKKIVYIAIAIALCGLSLLTSCKEVAETPMQSPAATPSPSLEKTLDEQISDVIKTKLQALEDKDIELYLSTVTQNDIYYYNEQSRWYSEMAQSVIRDISLEIVSVEPIDATSLVAVIHQTHIGNGEHFDFTYPLLFKLDNGEWKDYGYNFESIANSRYTLKYMPGETRVNEFEEMIDIAYDNLESIFAEKADDNFEIKLYWDREMLRQRTIPSAAFLFTGWGEPNESLKLYTGNPDLQTYHGTIQHELVHHITIKICNNNLADWLLEGTAVYFGNAYYDYSLTNSLVNLKKSNIAQTIDELNNTDLYHAESQQQVWDWYNTGFGYVEYIIETYGVDKFIELYTEAGKKPFNDSVTNTSFKADTIQTTSEVLIAVLGITPEQLSENYLEWLKTTDFFDFAD